MRTLLLDGNKVPGTTRFRNQFGFTDAGPGVQWLTLDESLQLSAGEHRIALEFQSGNDTGEVLIDHLQVLDETNPSMTSTRSLMMNNWTDLVGIHHSSVLAPDDDTEFGPRLAALHYKQDWPVNQIDGATAYFRDESTGQAYTDVHSFDSDLYFTEDGLMHVDYLNYGEEALPVAISKEYAMVPNQPILLARYRLENVTGTTRTIDLMEMADLNPAGDSGQQVNATWHSDVNAWIADLSATNGTYLVLGTFGSVTSHGAGQPAEGQTMGQGSDLLGQFESQGTLQNNSKSMPMTLPWRLSDRQRSLPGRVPKSLLLLRPIELQRCHGRGAVSSGNPQSWFDQTAGGVAAVAGPPLHRQIRAIPASTGPTPAT
ncbi:MAG: hypothetical protein R2940_07455 [Syntrophotaleaceae bacterium]